MRFHVLLKVVLRSFFLQAWWNYKRLQSIGLLYSILPCLKKLHSGDMLQKRVIYYTEYFNTNPYFASIIMGVLCNLEEKLAKGESSEEEINLFKTRLMSTFGSIGDAITWNGVRPVAAFFGGLIAFFHPFLAMYCKNYRRLIELYF